MIYKSIEIHAVISGYQSKSLWTGGRWVIGHGRWRLWMSEDDPLFTLSPLLQLFVSAFYVSLLLQPSFWSVMAFWFGLLVFCHNHWDLCWNTGWSLLHESPTALHSRVLWPKRRLPISRDSSLVYGFRTKYLQKRLSQWILKHNLLGAHTKHETNTISQPICVIATC